MTNHASVPTEGLSQGGPVENTDRHLWPQTSVPGAREESIHVTASGGIGINVGGKVIVMPLPAWHEAAEAYLRVFAYDGGKSVTSGSSAGASEERICRSPLARTPILYTDTVQGKEVHRDDLWAVTTAELNALEDRHSPEPGGEGHVPSDVRAAIEDYNSLLRTFHSVAGRYGRSTTWEGLQARIKEVLDEHHTTWLRVVHPEGLTPTKEEKHGS